MASGERSSGRVVVVLSNARRAEARPRGRDDGPDADLLADGLAAAGLVLRERRLNGFPLNPLARMGTFYAGFDPVRALTVLLCDRRADLVLSIGESNITLILLLRRMFAFRPRVVLREVASRGWSKRDRVNDFVLPRVDCVQAITPHQKAWIETAFRLKAPAAFVGFAVDEVFFRPLDRPDGGYVLAVGDDSGRDYACLIAALAETPYTLVLRSDARPDVPDAMRGRVKILPRTAYPALRDLYAAASVVVVPSRVVDHPSGITTLFEGMAMGRAMVASDIGAANHAVRDGANGVLVPAGDAPALRAAIVRLMQDAALRARLGNAARETIVSEFSYASYVRRFAANLLEVAARA
jgi:glycosyltransferase involved in cell wall biosynthesis